jgi:hypothetical protein
MNNLEPDDEGDHPAPTRHATTAMMMLLTIIILMALSKLPNTGCAQGTHHEEAPDGKQETASDRSGSQGELPQLFWRFEADHGS